MKDKSKYLFPKDMRCPNCNALLTLNTQEMLSGSLSCPECDAVLDHTEITKPVGIDYIYCPTCHSDYLKAKQSCPNCGAKNTFFEQPESGATHAPFLFRTMITGELISIAYILGAILITIISLAIIFFFDFYADAVAMRFFGFVLLVIGNIVWRVTCERWVLFFSTHKILSKILGELEYLNEKEND